MADNIVLDPGADGAIIAAASLTISGDTADVQMIGCGLLSGSEGSWVYSQFVGGAGAVAAGVQRVTLASDDPAVAKLGTIDADTGAIKTAVELLDNAISGNEMQVDIVSIAAGDNNIGNFDVVSLPAGNLGMRAMAASLSVVPASDITDGTYVGDIKFGEALPAGTNAIGKLAANTGVDIGDVDVTSIVPGTGATNLGKAIDSVVGATDTGIALLGKHSGDSVHITTADGDYEVVRVSDFGGLQTSPEQHHTFDAMNATTGWAALGNDTLNLATTKKHILGTDALTFDKVNGAANTIFAGIAKTVSSVDLGDISPHDLIQTMCYLPTLTDVAYVFVRVGTDSSNYAEWRVADTDLTAATFEVLALSVGDSNYAGITGNGWNPSAITYVVVGVAFDAETNALAGIVFDEVSFHTNQHTSATLNAEVSSSVSSANVNLQKIGGSVADKGAGNVSNGSQRVVLATDDINTAAIKTAVELIDDAIYIDDADWSDGSNKHMLVGGLYQSAPQSITDGDVGPFQVDSNGRLLVKLASNTGVDVGDVDILSLPSGNLGAQAMAASLSTTLATDDTHYGAVGAAADVDGVVHGQLRYAGETLATIDADTGAIKTAVEIMDDWDDGSDHCESVLVAGTAEAGFVGAAGQSDYAYDGTTKCTVKRFKVLATADGDDLIAAPSGTKKIRLRSLSIIGISTTGTTIYLQTAGTADELGSAANPIPIGVDADGNNHGGIVLDKNDDGWLETTTADEALEVKMPGGNQAMLFLGTYIEVA